MRPQMIEEFNTTIDNPDIEYVNVKLYECPCRKSIMREFSYFYKSGVPMGELQMLCNECLSKWDVDLIFSELVESWYLIPKDKDDKELQKIEEQAAREAISLLQEMAMTPEKFEKMFRDYGLNEEADMFVERVKVLEQKENERIAQLKDNTAEEMPEGLSRRQRRLWQRRHNTNNR